MLPSFPSTRPHSPHPHFYLGRDWGGAFLFSLLLPYFTLKQFPFHFVVVVVSKSPSQIANLPSQEMTHPQQQRLQQLHLAPHTHHKCPHPPAQLDADGWGLFLSPLTTPPMSPTLPHFRTKTRSRIPSLTKFIPPPHTTPPTTNTRIPRPPPLQTSSKSTSIILP